MGSELNLALTLSGLGLALLTIVLPMTEWKPPLWMSRALFAVAVAMCLFPLVLGAWSIGAKLSAPLNFASEVLTWPATRSVLAQLTVLFVVLIFVEWFQVRPFHRRIQYMEWYIGRYVLPRHLTDEQKTAISEYLSNHKPQSVKLRQPRNNEEASSYMADFQNALTVGGWTIQDIEIVDGLQEGIGINYVQPLSEAQQRSDPGHPMANVLLLEALKAANIQCNYSGGASGVGITERSLALSIGPRRMDDGDEVALQDQIDQIHKLVNERKRYLQWPR